MTVPAYFAPLDEVTSALLDLFKLSGREVYDGRYDGDPVRPAYPYGILYSVPGGNADPMPTLDLDRRTATGAWQVTAVSNYRNQAQRTAGMFRDLLTARSGSGWVYPLTVPDGWVCIARDTDAVVPGVDSAGLVPNAIYSAPVPFTVTIAPA